MDIRPSHHQFLGDKEFPPVQHWDIVVNGLGHANLGNLIGGSPREKRWGLSSNSSNDIYFFRSSRRLRAVVQKPHHLTTFDCHHHHLCLHSHRQESAVLSLIIHLNCALNISNSDQSLNYRIVTILSPTTTTTIIRDCDAKDPQPLHAGSLWCIWRFRMHLAIQGLRALNFKPWLPIAVHLLGCHHRQWRSIAWYSLDIKDWEPEPAWRSITATQKLRVACSTFVNLKRTPPWYALWWLEKCINLKLILSNSSKLLLLKHLGNVHVWRISWKGRVTPAFSTG